MSISSDKSASIHSNSDDSRDNDNNRDQDSSPEEYLTKGRGTTQGKGQARKRPAKKTTTGKNPKLNAAVLVKACHAPGLADVTTAKRRGKTFGGNTNKQDNTLGKKYTHGKPLGRVDKLELKGRDVAEH